EDTLGRLRFGRRSEFEGSHGLDGEKPPFQLGEQFRLARSLRQLRRDQNTLDLQLRPDELFDRAYAFGDEQPSALAGFSPLEVAGQGEESHDLRERGGGRNVS